MSLNVTQSNNNLTLQVSQSNVKATLSVTQNINELHITAIQNNEIIKLQPIVNTNSSDFIETDPIFQASEASLFAAGDKDKLDSIEVGAEVNIQSDWNQINPLDDSYIKNKPTIPTVLTNHSELTLDDGTNPHGTTKSDIGLSNVDNTSDIDKPISTAAQITLNSKLDKVTTVDVEKVYIKKADGTQGTKAASNFKDVIEGYFNGINFYTDALFTNLITPESSRIYINVAVTPATQYRWSGSAYVQIGGEQQNYKVIAQNFTDSSPITGTTAITTVETFDIPGDTFIPGDTIIFKARIIKTGTNDRVSHRHELGNEGFPQIEMFAQTSSATHLYHQIERTIIVKSATITEEILSTVNVSTSNGSYLTNHRANIDWTIPQTLKIGLNNTSASDSSIISAWQLIRIRP